jgi:hypothetical protein
LLTLSRYCQSLWYQKIDYLLHKSSPLHLILRQSALLPNIKFPSHLFNIILPAMARRLEWPIQVRISYSNYSCISHFPPAQYMFGSQDSVVGIATGYGVDDRGVKVQVLVGSRIFSSPCRPDRLWGSPSLISKGYRGIFPRG